MQKISLILKLLFFLLVLAFAVKNFHSMQLNFYFGLSWQAPVVLILFLFFFAGIIFGLLVRIPRDFKLRRENIRLRKELKKYPENYKNITTMTAQTKQQDISSTEIQ